MQYLKQFIFTSLICLAVTGLQARTSEAMLRAGVASTDITPSLPAWLSGYASRQSPARGVLQPIRARALVIEQNADQRIIFVTADLLGFSHEIVEGVFKAVQVKYGIRRSQLLMNASHTHSGPMIWPNLDVIYDFSLDDQREIAAYTQELTQKIVAVIDQAMADLAPAKLYNGHGSADFAINRRNGAFPTGPVDHDVPVVKITGDNGKIRALLFGYACHNTTLVDDNYLVNGDYAGFAQSRIEADNPGAIALFLTGCAGDQNPSPRGTVGFARQHGDELAAAVEQVLKGKMTPVLAPVRTEYDRVFLAYRPFDPAAYQKDIRSEDKFLQRRARLMLEAYNKGWPVDKLPYSIQAVRFGNDLTILGMSDEVVVDYSLLFKKMYPGENLFVAGYCNEVQCYIPSKRVLQEGGYEGGDNMIYYGMPGRFADDVEERIVKTVSQIMKNLGVKSTPSAALAREYQLNENRPISRLKGTLGTYAFPPRLPGGETDNDKLIRQLKDIHANTYHWLAWGAQSDLAALKKFLPLAARADIKVWITLVPPSESPPFAKDYSEPYRLDYYKWAAALAELSIRQPNLVAWSIDDFAHNLDLFTPDYVKGMLDRVKKINPGLAFIPCVYYSQVTPRFVADYGAILDGILFPYRSESEVANLADAGNVPAEIAALRSLFAPGFPIFLDVYATGHSSYGQSTPAYVAEVLRAGRKDADGVLIYCHQDPDKYPEKYRVLKEGFAAKR